MSSGEWEFIQDWLRKGSSSYNTKVNNYFKDVSSLDNSAFNARSAAKRACFIKDNDSAVIAFHKRMNFYFEVLESHLKPDVFGIPVDADRSVRRSNIPQVSLHFEINRRTEDNDLTLIHAEQGKSRISFRLMQETSESITVTKAEQLAKKIKNTFANGKGYLWSKGKTMYSYSEWQRGYQFQLLCISQQVAKDLITQVLTIQDHTPNWTYLHELTNNNPRETYPDNPGKVTILGDKIKLPKERPVVNVRFRYATLYCPPRKPITLLDKAGLRASWFAA